MSAPGRSEGTRDGLAQAVVEYLSHIERGCHYLWRVYPHIRRRLPQPEDALQVGVLHCLRYGFPPSYSPGGVGQVPVRVHLFVLAQQGVRRAARGSVQGRRGDRFFQHDPARGVPDCPDPRDDLAAADHRMDVPVLLGGLGERERLTLVLYHGLDGGGGLSTARVAERLGVSQTTVVKWLRRAHARLAAEYGPWEE